jgi:hypothetical protein
VARGTLNKDSGCRGRRRQKLRIRRRAGGVGARIIVRQGGQKVQGLETLTYKEGRGCRRQKLRVRRWAGGAGTRGIN